MRARKTQSLWEYSTSKIISGETDSWSSAGVRPAHCFSLCIASLGPDTSLLISMFVCMDTHRDTNNTLFSLLFQHDAVYPSQELSHEEPRHENLPFRKQRHLSEHKLRITSISLGVCYPHKLVLTSSQIWIHKSTSLCHSLVWDRARTLSRPKDSFCSQDSLLSI